MMKDDAPRNWISRHLLLSTFLLFLVAVIWISLVYGPARGIDLGIQITATLLGVLFAFVTSHETDRGRQRDLERRIFRSLANELREGEVALKTRLEGQSSTDLLRNLALLHPIKDELWHAMSGGGGLASVADPEKVALAADAYYRLRIVRSLETRVPPLGDANEWGIHVNAVREAFAATRAALAVLPAAGEAKPLDPVPPPSAPGAS